MNQKLNQMKYTDGMITFPIRVYDQGSIMKAARVEEDTNTAQAADWIEGYADIPLNEIKGVFDYFSKGRDVDDVEERGFDGCLIMTNSLGEFICTWKREKFKNELNNFANKYQDTLEKFVQAQVDRKIALAQAEAEAEIEQEMKLADEEKPPSLFRRIFYSRRK